MPNIEISNCNALYRGEILRFFKDILFFFEENMIAVNVENKIAIKKSNQNNKIPFTNGIQRARHRWEKW